MTPAALIEVAERVEGLEGASREVDARIWCALNGKRYKGHNPSYFEPHLTQVEFTEPPKRTRMVTQSDGPFNHAPPWTASLDAAMSLVPEGWDWAARSFGEDGCHASVWQHGWHDDTVIEVLSAATPALALTAAALRARAKMAEGAEVE